MSPRLKSCLPLLGYAAAVFVLWEALAPASLPIWLPLYGNDHIKLTAFGGVLFLLGALFAIFGAWGMSRGAQRNGMSAILLGCAAPMATGSPIALVVSLPTLVLAMRLSWKLAERPAYE